MMLSVEECEMWEQVSVESYSPFNKTSIKRSRSEYSHQTHRLSVTAATEASAESIVAASSFHFCLSFIVGTGGTTKSLDVGTSLTM